MDKLSDTMIVALPLTLSSQSEEIVSSEVDLLYDWANESKNISIERYFVSSGVDGAVEVVILILATVANVAAIADMLWRYRRHRRNAKKTTTRATFEYTIIQKRADGSLKFEKTSSEASLDAVSSAAFLRDSINNRLVHLKRPPKK